MPGPDPVIAHHQSSAPVPHAELRGLSSDRSPHHHTLAV